jgi:hypothetical protein
VKFHGNFFQIGGQAEKFPRYFSENFSETKSVITAEVIIQWKKPKQHRLNQ